MTAFQFEVKAKENSVDQGTGLDTGVAVSAGDKLKITVSEDQTWSAGAADRNSNANGLIAGNRFGGVYPPHSTKGFSFPIGSLVGSLDGGKTFFLVGTNYDGVAPVAGRLSLFFWDSISHDNFGSVTASVSLAASKEFEVKAKENSAVGGVPFNTGIIVSSGDTLKVSVALDQKWWNGPKEQPTNADGVLANGQRKETISRNGFSAAVGSLVGSLDGGKTFFLLGSNFEGPVSGSGPLSLFYWDSDSANNSGSVKVNVTLNPAALAALAPKVVIVPSNSYPAVPAGLKPTSTPGPDNLNSSPNYPTVQYGGFTYWPFSYIDNRVSFGIVGYDSTGKLVRQFEKPGARYIWQITVETAAKTVTFWGQANQKVVVRWAELQ
jgi:hypothetical protein